MSRGKSRNRKARNDIMRSNASNARRKAREQARAKGYDRTKYDKPQLADPSPT
ncbi:MAG: hypothetical protein WCP70_04285 [Methanothrix sp.]